MVWLSDQRFMCCFCLHVRTGTILLGIGQILVHLMCISVLILMTMRPDLLREGDTFRTDDDKVNDIIEKHSPRSRLLSLILHLVPGAADMQESLVGSNPTQSSKLKSEVDNEPVVYLNEKSHSVTAGDSNEADTDGESVDYTNLSGLHIRLYKRDSPNSSIKNRPFSPYFALCLSTFSLAFCCFLVHGAISRQPTHLLPFFFLQVFDFIISLLTVVNYMSTPTDVRFVVHTKNKTVSISSANLTFVILTISCVMLAFKAYCLGMVWDCYKYLMLTNQSGGVGNGIDAHTGGWSRGRFGLLPTIWSFMGTGRASFLSRHRDQSTGGVISSEQRVGVAPDGFMVMPQPTYDQSNDLPNYDDALKIPANAYAPPPYFQSNGNKKKPQNQTASAAHHPGSDADVTTQVNTGVGGPPNLSPPQA